MSNMSTDLVAIQALKGEIIFAPGGIDKLIDQVAAEVRAFEGDISTKAGRQAIASFAYKVARSKTAIDALGKDLAANLKRQTTAIDNERRRAWDAIEALQAEARKPLTDWEEAEQQRVTDHENALELIAETALDVPEPAHQIQQRINQLVDFSAPHFRDWQEFKQRADGAIAAAHAILVAAMTAATKREADAIELERLRAEQLAREQRERDEKIAAAAAELARHAAEAKAAAAAVAAAQAARREQERVEAERHAAQLDAVRAESERREAQLRADEAEAARIEQAAESERDRIAAAAQAKRDKAAAIEAERERVAHEQAAAAAATAAREADKKHRARINNEAVAALQKAGLSHDYAVAVVTAIARGEVPHVKIGY